MIDRLKVIMETEGLNYSQLADRLHIQRSGLSHILSGRNNPSLDFVKKVLMEFPQYSMEWFIFGDTNVNNAANRVVYKSKQQDELSLFDDDNSKVHLQPKPTKSKAINLPSIETETVNNKNHSVVLEKASTNQLVKVILVYENHTFEELKRIENY
jgi:transcriptional regulator with XRE-family HTH domain